MPIKCLHKYVINFYDANAILYWSVNIINFNINLTFLDDFFAIAPIVFIYIFIKKVYLIVCSFYVLIENTFMIIILFSNILMIPKVNFN